MAAVRGILGEAAWAAAWRRAMALPIEAAIAECLADWCGPAIGESGGEAATAV